MLYPVSSAPGVYVDHASLGFMVNICSDPNARIILVGFGEYAKHLVNLCGPQIVAIYDPEPWKVGMKFRGVPVLPLGEAVAANLILCCEYELLYDFLRTVRDAHPGLPITYPPQLHHMISEDVDVFVQEDFYKKLLKDTSEVPISMMGMDKIKFLIEILRLGLTFEGHIVEMGSWQGGSLWFIAKSLLLLGEERNLYGMDLFETHSMDPTATMCNDEIARRMSFYPKMKMIVGLIDDQQCLAQIAPGPICFAHMDLGPIPGALEFLWDRLAVGAPLLLDNYGHLLAPPWDFDAFFEKRGTRVVRLPWSEQGLVIKR